ncbi:PAS domain S-box protein [Terriglobus albidus]|uniref:PAS domain S-box protein n=1 Tax=Terriglobus albidus TaxID=1592106 RepID=UPI0021E0E133|nr:PAS domain S-box protein [Terriglobus albidus]
MSQTEGSSKSETRWPFTGGAMAEAIRTFNWSSTELGPIDTWPAGLLFAIDMMLGCAFPATLQWGRNLILFYNDAYIPLVGTHHPHALGQPLLSSFPEISTIYAPFAQRVWNGERIVLEDQLFHYTRNDVPEDRWFNLSYSPVHDRDGSVCGILTIGLETTAKVLAEMARSTADIRLKRILETDAVGVIFFDYTGTVVDANDVFLRMVGYSRAEIETRTITWRTMTPPEWVRASEEQMEKLEQTGRIGPYEKEYMLKDGSRRWMLFTGRDLGDNRIVEYAIDITRRKEAEAATQAMEERFRALVEASSDVIYRMSPDWKEMRQLQGRDFLADTAEPERTWLDKYIHPEDQAFVWASIQQAIKHKKIFQLEHRVLQADGTIGWTFSRAVPLFNKGGEIIEWFGAASDVSARKRAEEALLRSEKLATLGRLVASIAHEINNPLEAMSNLIYLAHRSEGLPEEARELLELADAELKRIAHITRQSLGFYRESNIPSDTSVTQLLESSIDLLRGKINTRHAMIDFRLKDDITVKAVAGELRQVFSNLLANALDALDTGGQITIRATRRAGKDGPYVSILFLDTGRGIPLETQHKIFDPFFSTKGHLGTGLGLWVTKQIVDKHRGSIRVRSRILPPTTGTVFQITLPA